MNRDAILDTAMQGLSQPFGYNDPKESGQQYEQREDGDQIPQHENFCHGLRTPKGNVPMKYKTILFLTAFAGAAAIAAWVAGRAAVSAVVEDAVHWFQYFAGPIRRG
jgi:hypothetical protein